MDREAYLRSVEAGVSARGRTHLLRFLKGERITLGEAVMAYCYDCTGFLDEGRRDCENDMCALHPFMLYNPNRQRAVASTETTPGDKEEAA